MSENQQVLNMPQAAECVAMLETGIKRSFFSAAQLLVSDPSGVRIDVALGTTLSPSLQNAYQRAAAVTHETLFDVASLTKPLATAGLTMIAADAGLLSTDQKLLSFGGVLFPPWLLGSTVGDLLSHHTMLAAWEDLSQYVPIAEKRKVSLRAIIEQGLYRAEPRSDGKTHCYSDLGYILLGFLLERLFGDSLPNLFDRRIAEKLGLTRTMTFFPLHKTAMKDIVATCKLNGHYIQGHPDDANARLLTHCAGHAGLFAAARAVDAYMRSLFDGSFPCSRRTIDAFTRYRNSETPYALGWDRPTADDSLSGAPVGAPVIGHLGFTGCSVWFDLEKLRCVTLLTNRTHTCGDRNALNEIRRNVCRLCWNAR